METKEPKDINEENDSAKVEGTDSEVEAGEADAKIAELEAKNAELNDKYLRVVAEYDNFRKRTAKERDEIYSNAYIDAVKQILPIIDNMERAQAYEGSVSEGVNMIITAMKQALEKMGVTEIETKTFDPNLHNAVMHIDDESYGENEIVEVFQKGYMLNDKVVRFAMVKVAN